MRPALFIKWRPLPHTARPLCATSRRTLLTKAFDTGPSYPPLLEQTVPEHFASIVRQHGDRHAVISRHQQKRLTYDALDRDSNALARGLEKRGVRKESRVAVSLGNSVEFATLTYALFKLGAILIPLNPAFTPPQIAAALSHLTTSHLVISSETNLPRKPPSSNLPSLQHLLSDLNAARMSSELVPSLQSVILVDNTDPSSFPSTTNHKALEPYTSVLHDGSTTPLSFAHLDKNDTVNIQFTSGTTSTPKAAALSHRSILNNGHSIGSRMLLTPQDIVCCPPPLFHCFGCILGYMATATHGAAIVFPSEAFDALATLRSVGEEGATALYGVPTMFLGELDLLDKARRGQTRPEDADYVDPAGMKTLRTGIAAGSQVPSTLMTRLHNELNLRDLTICYGMTETSPVSLMTSTTDPIEKRVDSVGKLLPHVTAKIVRRRSSSSSYDPALSTADPDEEICDIGERGELVVSGYLIMSAYWNDPARTAEVRKVEHYTVPSGEQKERVWMYTGDEAVMDADGYVKITGRLKDIIIRGGENIHPLDVENVLLGCEGVGEVSCYGVPDGRYGEIIAVSVIRRPGVGKNGSQEGMIGEDNVRRWVREKLANHFVPKYVFFVDGLPKTPSGKIQRFKLRQDAIEKLGLET